MAARRKARKPARKPAKSGSNLHRRRISEGVKAAHKRRRYRTLFSALKANPGALHREMGIDPSRKIPDSALKRKLAQVRKQKGAKARRTERRVVAALTAHAIVKRRMAKKGVRWTSHGKRR